MIHIKSINLTLDFILMTKFEMYATNDKSRNSISAFPDRKLTLKSNSIKFLSEDSIVQTNLDALILEETETVCYFSHPCPVYKLYGKKESRIKTFIIEKLGVYYVGNIRCNTLLSYTIDEYGLAYLIAMFLVSLAFIWNVYTIPLRWAFVGGTLLPTGNLTNTINIIPNSPLYYIVDLLADTIYVLDIVLIQSRTQYISHSQGVKITSVKMTAWNYFCSWEFYFDLFSIIFPWVPELQYFGTGMYHSLFRITRYLKFKRFNKFLLLVQRKLHYAQLFRQLRVLFQIILIAHTLGCVFFLYYILQGQKKNGIFAGFLVVENEDLHPLMFSFYWGFVIITNIHNQPRPTEDGQYIFMVICHLIGSLHMAYVFAVFVSSLRVGNWHRNAFRIKAERSRSVFTLFKEKDEITKTRGAITDYYDYGYANHIELLENAILNYFPRRMRINLAQECYFKTLKKVYLFKGLSDSFFIHLLLKFENRVYLPKEDVYRIGDIGNELFIITKGQIKLIEGEKSVGSLKPGQIFGYRELFATTPSERFRSITAQTLGFTHLLVFHKRLIDTILDQLPKDNIIIRKTVRDMAKVFKIQRMRTLPLLKTNLHPESPKERAIIKLKNVMQVIQVLIYIFHHIPKAESSDETSSGDETTSLLGDLKTYVLPTIRYNSDQNNIQYRTKSMSNFKTYRRKVDNSMDKNNKIIRTHSLGDRKPINSLSPTNSLSYRKREKMHFVIKEKRLYA